MSLLFTDISFCYTAWGIKLAQSDDPHTALTLTCTEERNHQFTTLPYFTHIQDSLKLLFPCWPVFLKHIFFTTVVFNQLHWCIFTCLPPSTASFSRKYYIHTYIHTYESHMLNYTHTHTHTNNHMLNYNQTVHSLITFLCPTETLCPLPTTSSSQFMVAQSALSSCS